jgi:7,8-dihydropterin-6-yl-methyl-4-(beta-D-ribofuranosyl)aminobenzene 5'-phosphate synthase
MTATKEKGTSRRDFIRGTATGVGVGVLAAAGVFSYSPWRKSLFPEAIRNQVDIGVCKSVKVTNISETSWFSNSDLIGDIKKAGGLLVNQYSFNWPPFCDGGELAKGSYESSIAKIKEFLPDRLDEAWEYIEANAVHPENAGGFSCLVEIEDLDGTIHKILFDTGWSYKWMDDCFKREGIDKMLENGEIEALFITHEHFDHFWGLPVTLKYDPNIHIIIPDTFYNEGKQYIKDCGHKGKVTEVASGVNKIMPGVASLKFDIPIICRVFGEQDMFFNVKNKGLVSVTGCCHQGIIKFVETAYKEIKYENDNLFGLYGGLHISPFEDWDPKYDDLVISLGKYDFDRIGCNHCTGIVTAKKFIETGYPVVKGTARFRSQDTAYLGNGDTIEFKS